MSTEENIDLVNRLAKANEKKEVDAVTAVFNSLKEYIPKEHRRAIRQQARYAKESLVHVYDNSFEYGKNATWIVSTSFLILFFPLAMQADREIQLMQLEKEQELQQQMMSPYGKQT